LRSSRERSFGSSIARVAESILFARRPIEKYLDIGSGPGYLLDALSFYLPTSKEKFFGVERYPPPAYTNNKNFIVGKICDMGSMFDAGCCIEVIEHLTPAMASSLFEELAIVSNPGALYIFNTCLPEYVSKHDPKYMYPIHRGHIVSYSLKAISLLSGKYGFEVKEVEGKGWAYIVEYKPTEPSQGRVVDRIWRPMPENKSILQDPISGSVCYSLGIEAARAYV
jgi:hypothetical protein